MSGWRVLIVVALLCSGGVSACTSRTAPEARPVEATAAQKRAEQSADLAMRAENGESAASKSPRSSDEAEPKQRRRLSYRLQIGDEMDVQFYKTPELNTHVKIRPDGNITLPYVGDVRAADQEPADLASLLEERYTGELRVPRITVNVTQFSGQRVYIGGEVVTPGVVQLVGPVTALQAIQQAGGFRDTASVSSIVLIRRSGGQAKGTEVDLSDVMDGDDLEQDPLLQPYDIVFVPRTYIADIDIFVDQYIRKILPMNPSFGIGLGTF